MAPATTEVNIYHGPHCLAFEKFPPRYILQQKGELAISVTCVTKITTFLPTKKN
jgi:hypothetical protein